MENALLDEGSAGCIYQQQPEKEEVKHECESSSNCLSVFITPKRDLEVLILPVNMFK